MPGRHAQDLGELVAEVVDEDGILGPWADEAISPRITLIELGQLVELRPARARGRCA